MEEESVDFYYILYYMLSSICLLPGVVGVLPANFVASKVSVEGLGFT